MYKIPIDENKINVYIIQKKDMMWSLLTCLITPCRFIEKKNEEYKTNQYRRNTRIKKFATGVQRGTRNNASFRVRETTKKFDIIAPSTPGKINDFYDTKNEGVLRYQEQKE